MQKRSSSSVTLQMGQVWQVGDARLEIGAVGRTLVHYRHYRGTAMRPPTQLSAQATLEAFLKKNRAVLLQESANCPPAGVLRFARPREKKPATTKRTTRTRKVQA